MNSATVLGVCAQGYLRRSTNGKGAEESLFIWEKKCPGVVTPLHTPNSIFSDLSTLLHEDSRLL